MTVGLCGCGGMEGVGVVGLWESKHLTGCFISLALISAILNLLFGLSRDQYKVFMKKKNYMEIFELETSAKNIARGDSKT